MEVVRSLFESCCETLPQRCASRAEWRAFVTRLAAADGRLGDSELRALERVWDRTGGRAFGGGPEAGGGDERGLTFDEFVQVLVDDAASGRFGQRARAGPAAETERSGLSQALSPAVDKLDASLGRVHQQLNSLGTLCREWALDGPHLSQVLEVTRLLQAEQRRAAPRVSALVARVEAAYLGSGGSGGADAVARSAAAFQLSRAADVERVCAATSVRGALAVVDEKGNRLSKPMRLTDRLGVAVRGGASSSSSSSSSSSLSSKGAGAFGTTGAHSGAGASGIELTLGQTRDGELVAVVALNGAGASDQDIAFASCSHAALRELILSRHVPKWMGHSRSGELFFEHLVGAVSVEQLLHKHGVLVEPQPLLQSIAAQACEALADVLEQSTFELISPISARNLFLVNDGARVVLGRLEWGDRPEFLGALDSHDLAAARAAQAALARWHRARESRLLGDLGRVLRALVGLPPKAETQSHLAASGLRPQQEASPTDGRTQWVFSRAQCSGGLRIAEGDRFRLALPSSAPGKVWRCAKIADAGPGAFPSTDAAGLGQAHQQAHQQATRSTVLQLEAPATLEFAARRPGLCRVLLREAEWWQAESDTPATTAVQLQQRAEDDGAAALHGASMLCRVNVTAKGEAAAAERAACSPALLALVATCCSANNEKAAPGLTLRALQRKYDMLRLDVIDEQRVMDDLAAWTGT